MQRNRNVRTGLLILKLLLFAGLSLLLYKQVIRHKQFEDVAGIFKAGLEGDKRLIIAALALTMALNWFLEMVKWKHLIGKFLELSWLRTLKGVLFGIAFSLFTPNRVGEFGGRVAALNQKRGEGIVATLLGSLSQIVMNLSLGGLGLVIYVFLSGDYGYMDYVVVFLWIILAGGLILIYYNLDVIEGVLLKVPLLRRVKDQIDVIQMYSRGDLTNYLILSGSRCLIYYFQFWLCLKFFAIDIDLFHALVMIAAMYFIQTAVPSFAIIELVFRGNVALYFMSAYTENTGGVFSATFLIWFVNLIIPAFLGLLLVLRHRFLTD